MKVIIDHLFKHPEHYCVVSDMIHRAFWLDKPGHSPQRMEERLRLAHSDSQIPLSFVALSDGLPVGTVNLVESDDDERTHLRPWLAALIVSPEHRNKGIGSRLVSHLKDKARALGISELFLGTDQPGFYLRLGAKCFEQVREGFWIMRIDLGGPDLGHKDRT